MRRLARLGGQAARLRAAGRGLFSATGPLASADPEGLRGKPWAADVFTPMQFPYRIGVWRGPLIVLVDGDTASAAEGFAAELQDGRAAVILGVPTYGAGGSHTEGGTPTRLSHSGAVLQVSDFVRFRADGENTIQGVEPDVLVGFRRADGARRRAAAAVALLPVALAKLQALTRVVAGAGVR